MNFRTPAIGGAILGAGGIGYWAAAPALVASVLLGSADACGCAARLSDFSERWANCAIANAAIGGKLDVLFEGADGIANEVVPSPPRKMSLEQTRLMNDVVNPACGSFADARAADLKLRAERRSASYEDLFVPGSFEDTLWLTNAGQSYQHQMSLKNSKPSKEAPSA